VSFLLRFEAIMANGEVLQDESVVCELPVLEVIEKRASVFGRDVTMRFTFDPPLTVRGAESDA
jgi:hypothetical protein